MTTKLLNKISRLSDLSNAEIVHQPLNEIEIAEGNYIVRFARSWTEIDAALRLRFAVFNLELGEGLQTSYLTGRDEDKFDRFAFHLICLEKNTNEIVGTYRLQIWETACTVSGFYTSTEFKLGELPLEVLTAGLEMGRACIARQHRHTKVLFLLWKGLARLAKLQGKRYFFGCCSLTSQSEEEGFKVFRLLQKGNSFHESFWVAPQAGYLLRGDIFENTDIAVKLPKLFQTYLRFGAKVCSPPAIDRDFQTIDFFVLFDLETIDQRIRKMFFDLV
ncbi:MAG: GNAT family N-acyltransferase [Acidobacteriota bacterium]